jgi:CubicO group peptidase (beta-lactamase class C family)
VGNLFCSPRGSREETWPGDGSAWGRQRHGGAPMLLRPKCGAGQLWGTPVVLLEQTMGRGWLRSSSTMADGLGGGGGSISWQKGSPEGDLYRGRHLVWGGGTPNWFYLEIELELMISARTSQRDRIPGCYKSKLFHDGVWLGNGGARAHNSGR